MTQEERLIVDPVRHGEIFGPDVLLKLFPPERADNFFEALFGEAKEGAFDVSLKFKECVQSRLELEFHLQQRPGRCLTCSLTYGLPQVFSRHPVINVTGLIKEIDQLLDGRARCTDWRLGRTREASPELHVIPLIVSLDDSSHLA